ncbi:MAG TPA: hypothetical protein VFT13_03955 [Candidatus Krumholzibacteria bacterium]|nr:hypothetical protein [Candidatus Krumholzibacteria bacterium]
MKRITLALVCLVFVTAPAAAEEWKYDLVLYGWLAGLEGTIGVVDVAEQPVDAAFDDLVGFVDFAMAGHFEARSTKGLFVTDIAYTGLSSERDAVVANQSVKVEMDINQWIVEAGGGYRATREFDLFLVGRYYILDTGAMSSSAIGESTAESTKDWGDVYIGARYARILKEKWLVSLRGDIGAGGSEFAWFGNATVGYRFGEKFSAGVAWRVLSLDREGDPADSDYFEYDVTQSGLGIGLGYSF